VISLENNSANYGCHEKSFKATILIMHGLHFEDARLTFEGQIDESELEEFFRLV